MHMIKSLRTQIYQAIETTENDHPLEPYVRTFLGSMIVINILCVMFESMPSLNAWDHWFELVEKISIAIFLIEYLARVWSHVESGASPILGRFKFALTPMMLIDLSVLVVTFVPVFLDVRSLRALRLVRLLKLGRHSRALRLIVDVLARKQEELLSCMALTMIVLLIASSMMFYAEHQAQPEAFPSIPGALWWGVTAMSTVGYGDVVPITTLGRIIGGVVSMSVLGLFGLPSAILAAGFMEAFERDGKELESL